MLGAAGFIGRWVARALEEQGAETRLVVIERRSAERVFREYGIQGAVVESDIGDPASLRRVVEEAGPAITFNLAGYGVNRAERDERTFYAINVALVEHLCEALAGRRNSDWPGMELVHTGSIAEYGPIGGDLREDSPARPATMYGKSKLAGTRALVKSASERSVRAVAARLATIYGPGEHAGRLLPSLMEAARTGAPVELSAGAQKRDFTYVEDVAEGLLRLGLASAEPQAVNLVTGRLATVREFAETAGAVLGIPASNLKFGALPTRREEEAEHLPISTGRLRRLTRWTPGTGMAEGIRRTVSFVNRSSAKESQ
ncbi:MAG: NAD(P)-dependent oxidoreductase [Bryobacteraceae bacterium]|nr:NAD(P)-dependent oxidoreductase [Bryobacteraceae bacterium]